MEEQNQHIDQYFRDNLGGYTEQPDASVWNALEKRLDEKPRKRGFFWIWFFGFLVAAGLTLFTYNNYNNPPVASVTPTSTTNITTESKVATPSNTIDRPVSNTPDDTTFLPKAEKMSAPAATPQKTIATQQAATTATIVPAIARTDRNNDIPVQQEQLQPTPIHKDATAKDNTTPVAATVPQQNTPPATNAIKETNYSDLQPTAGKPKKAIPPADPETYYNLTPSSGKSSNKNPAQLPIAKNATTTETTTPAPLLQNKTSEQPVSTEPAQQVPGAKPVIPNTTQAPVAKNEIVKEAISSKPTGENITQVQVSKKDSTQKIQELSAAGITQPIKKSRANKFSAGIKAGYDMGTGAHAANKMIISPYLQYHFTPRFSLMIQPAAKYAKYNAMELSHTSYYRLTDTLKESLPQGAITPAGQEEQMIVSETYDSLIVKLSTPSVKQWEFDLPLLFNYKLLPGLEIYGGPHINIAAVISPQETTTTLTGIKRIDTIRLERRFMSALFDTPSISKVFPHKDAAYSTYTPFNNPNINPFRMGITFGASYVFKKRYTLDIVYLQNITGLNAITDEKQRQSYRQPYIRMTLGYRFIK